MINKIKTVFKDKDKKVLLENFLSLSTLQALNYILPLITLPYLIKVLGADKYGLIAFAQAFVGYFGLLIGYGFGLSATKDVSKYRNNIRKLSEIFSSVILIQISIFIFCLFIFTIIVFSFEKFREEWSFFYLVYFTLLGGIIFPSWIFQGLEKMKYITVINTLTRVLFTVLIFIVIKEQSDYYWVPLLNLFGGMIGGLWALWLIFNNFNIKFLLPSIQRIIYDLKEGWYIFISTVAYNIYNISPTFFIGIFIDNTAVAIYSLAEKIVNILRYFLVNIFMVFYPNLSNKVKNDFRTYSKMWKNLFKIAIPVSIILWILTLFFPKPIFLFFFSEEFLYSLFLLKILGFSLILQSLMNLFGMQSMLLLGYTKAYGVSYVVVTLIYILILPIILFFTKNLIYVVILILTTELIVILYRILYLQKKGVFIELFKG